MSSYSWPNSGGGGVPTYANLAAFPSAVTAGNGSLAIALDTNILYESNGITWLAIAEPGDVLSIGPFGSTPNANGLIITANALSMEPADGTHPGGVSILAQTFAGNKTFTGSISAANLSGTNSGDVTLTAVGSTPNANGASLSTQALTLQPANTSFPGVLLAADWNTFNNKQNALTFGNLTSTPTTNLVVTGGAGSVIGSGALLTLTGASLVEATSSVLTITGASNAVLGTGVSIQVKQSSASVSGYLSSTDWNTFNNKQSTTLTSAHLLVGNGSNLATDVAVSGDLTLSNTGAFTIANLAVTNAKIANATIDLTTKVTGTLPTANGGTGTNQTFISGSVIFADSSGNFTQDNSMFFWDDTTKRLSLQGHLDTAALGIVATGSEVGIALTSTATNTALNVQNQGAQFAAQFTNSTNSATQGAAFGGAFSRGTTTVPLVVQAGDQVTTWSGQSYNGSSYGPGYNAAIAILATENQTSTHNGGQIAFATTPNGSLAPVAGLIIGQNQALQLPTYTTAGVLVNDSSGNVTASAALVATKGGTSFNTYATGDLLYASASNTLSKLAIGSSTQVLTVTGGVPVWAPAAATGVTAVSVATANGLAGTSSGGSTPALTLSTTITGILQGNGTAISAASTTGSGNVVLSTSPTLVTPVLGTPTSGTLTNATGLPLTTGVAGVLPIANGGTNVSSVTTSPTATAFAGWDANKNLSMNNALEGYTTTATAAGTTTLVVGSTYQQFFTGTTTQTVQLPVTSTLVLGQSFYIVNNSTGIVTVNSSGGNQVIALNPNSSTIVTVILTSGTTAASWNSSVVTGTVVSVNIPNVTDWAAYTPTANGLGTLSGVFTQWRRVGDSIQIIGEFTIGTVSAAEARLTLPNGYLVDTTKITAAAIVGQIIATSNGAPYNVIASGAANNYVQMSSTTNTSGLTPANGNALFGNSNTLSINAVIPISGLTANTSLNVLGGGGFVQPTVQKFTSGTTQTYTTPANVSFIRVRMVGGGGGGGASGTSSGGNSTNGTASTFGTSLLNAGGGSGSGNVSGATTGGAGGTASLGSGPIGTAVPGSIGGSGSFNLTANILISSGFGAGTPFAGSIGGVYNGGGNAANVNTGCGGSGGGGGATANLYSGGGGGAGGYVDAIIASPSASYTYTVGAKGSGGTAGGSGYAGGDGGSGYIEVTEYYYNGAIGTATNVTGIVAVANGGTGLSASANGRYFSSTTTISGSLATVVYATQGFDARGNYNNSTGIFTCTVAGKYQFNAGIATAGTIALNSALDMQIQQTGSASQISEDLVDGAAGLTNLSTSVGDIFNLAVGDTIKVQVSSGATAPTIVSSNSRNYFSWSYLGT